MQVGDLVMCGDEAAIILGLWCQDGMVEGETEVIAECMWQNGDLDAVDVIDLELISESR